MLLQGLQKDRHPDAPWDTPWDGMMMVVDNPWDGLSLLWHLEPLLPFSYCSSCRVVAHSILSAVVQC